MGVKRYSVGVDGTDPNGNLVKYEDYAALEQRLEESQREFRAADATIENLQMQLNAEREAKLALVAENAGLKAGASCLVSEYMMNKGTDSEFIACITPSKKTIGTGGVWDMWRHLEMVLCKTPSTDDFLAEVRAQGVVMCSAEIQKQTWDEREGDGMVAAIDAMEIYAAQLRKGAQS